MIKRLIIGLNLPPAVVAGARAALLLGLTAIVGGLVTSLTTADWGEYAWAAPFVLAALRLAEGALDQWQTPHQNDA